MKIVITIVLSIIFSTSWGQIEIDNKIKNEPGDTLIISNLGTPSDSTELPSLNYIRENNPVFFSGVLSNDTLRIYLDSNLVNLQAGLVIFVKSSTSNSGPAKLSTGNDVFPIEKNNHQPLYKGEIIPGKIMVLAFVGNRFLLLNPEKGICPTGMIKVNTKYCIDQNETQGTFWNAITGCSSRGLILCSWSEWYYACLNSTALGINNMRNANWEWINQSQNEVTQGKAVGRTRCDITIHRDRTLNDYYRCCFDF